MKIKGLYLKNKKYVYQPPQVDGVRPKPIHLSTEDFSEAIRMVDALQRRKRIEVATEPLKELAERWRIQKRASGDHGSDSTSRIAKFSLNRFVEFFKRPGAITPEKINQWKAAMFEEELSPATIDSYMRYSQSFCSDLVAQGQLLENPFAQKSVAFPESIPTKIEKHCSKEERDRLINNCKDPDLKAVLFIGFHTGMRRGEILNIRPHWLQLDEKGRPAYFQVQNEKADEEKGTTAFRMKGAKGRKRKRKTIPISTPLADFLLDEYGIHREPYFVAPQFEPGKHIYRWDWKKKWANYMKSQGLDWVQTHTMRHTFVTLLLSSPDNRLSLFHLSQWTGDGEAVLRDHYAHLIDSRDLIDLSI